MRRVAEAIALAVGVAVVAMILRSGHFVLRAIVVIAIFAVDFILDASRARKAR